MATLVVYLACNDVEASAKWYCDVLGFQLDKNSHYPGLFAHIWLDGPNARASKAQLMLRSYPRADKDGDVAPGTKPPPVKLLFDISDPAKGKNVVDEKYEAVKKVKASGIAVELKGEPKDEAQDAYRGFEILDPSGHEVNFFAWL